MGCSFLCSLLGVKLVLRQLLIDSHKIEQTYALVTSLNTAKKYWIKDNRKLLTTSLCNTTRCDPAGVNNELFNIFIYITRSSIIAIMICLPSDELSLKADINLWKYMVRVVLPLTTSFPRVMKRPFGYCVYSHEETHERFELKNEV